MGYDIYIDGDLGGYFATSAGWDDAVTWIERHAPPRTPLRRLAEEGKTDQPRQAAAMLVDLVQRHKPSPDTRHTLRLLQRWLLRGHHVVISDGVIYEA